MSGTRRPAVAGTFYPAEPAELEAVVRSFLETATSLGGDEPVPKAIIAPHAGYLYSGPIAASAYARVAARRAEVERVVLLGPVHRVAVRGLAAPEADYFATPMGELPLDNLYVSQFSQTNQGQEGPIGLPAYGAGVVKHGAGRSDLTTHSIGIGQRRGEQTPQRPFRLR